MRDNASDAARYFREAADKRVRLGLLLRQVISEHDIKAGDDDIRARVEDMCSGYENAYEMVNMYLNNPQVMQQIEPMVVEQKAVEWLMENGKTKAKKVTQRWPDGGGNGSNAFIIPTMG